MMVDGVQTIEANGIAHWVRVAGAHHQTAPLVLIHGGPGGSAYPWEAIGDRIAEQYPIVFYDQRGCGRSQHPDDFATYTITPLVADLETLRTALGVDQIIPWGASFSGSQSISSMLIQMPRVGSCSTTQPKPRQPHKRPPTSPTTDSMNRWPEP